MPLKLHLSNRQQWWLRKDARGSILIQLGIGSEINKAASYGGSVTEARNA